MKIFKSYQTISVLNEHITNLNPIIIEIGAFQGHDTIKMKTQWPNATIHAFEPVPDLYKLLQEKTKSYANIYTYQQAISNSCNQEVFYLSEKPEKPGIPTQAGSLRKPKERLHYSPIIFPKTIQVQTITLDIFTKDKNIAAIDLLWIDTQGHEFSILKSGIETIKKTKFILTEVGFVESYEGQLLHTKIIAWLKENNFTPIARDFENTTDWFFGNILFQNNLI